MDCPLTDDDYTVACICPMGVELAAVEAMLDEEHPSLPSRQDKNSYMSWLASQHQHSVGLYSLIRERSTVMGDSNGLEF